ncbi:MFS transporter [Glutamicibacter uratoxydans]|uniref:MFS transporter n=1 Tax=Glutamicibacter uratoxydans TaxID=43667 RepID=A0A4Y4DII2_GLUUR|nr:MFS transporter [Glutamicibacter uratoxydans]GED05062.1 MFS transporter [Glutamicibacter uratoxydans]
MSESQSKRNQLTGPSRRLRAEDCIIADKKSLHQAQIGAGVGNFIEWYDIGVYGYLAVLMTRVFTEGMDQAWGLLVTLLGFAVSFVVRPIGGMILGPLGDRIGRRKVMLFTILLMAAATTLIGLLPSAGQVGLWVIIPLYLLKMLQGFSTGGEYSGAATYIAEFSPDGRRAFMTSLLNVGSQLGFAAGAGVVALTTIIAENNFGPDAMLNGGWRIPFLLALPLGIVAVSLRSRLPESPAFEVASEVPLDHDPDSIFVRHSLPRVIKLYWPHILVGMALIAADGTSSYTLTSYMPTYLETQVGIHASHTALAAVVILAVQAAMIPLFALLADKVGRKKVYMIATIGNLVLLLPAFALMQTGTIGSLYLALFLVSVPSSAFLALTACVMSELFPTASRYTGVGITHNLAISIFGGTTPLISQALVQSTGKWYVPAIYVMAFSLIALLALCKMRETAGRPLLGSFPVVASNEDAVELAGGQDTDPRIDTTTFPLTAVK